MLSCHKPQPCSAQISTSLRRFSGPGRKCTCCLRYKPGAPHTHCCSVLVPFEPLPRAPSVGRDASLYLALVFGFTCFLADARSCAGCDHITLTVMAHVELLRLFGPLWRLPHKAAGPGVGPLAPATYVARGLCTRTRSKHTWSSAKAAGPLTLPVVVNSHSLPPGFCAATRTWKRHAPSTMPSRRGRIALVAGQFCHVSCVGGKAIG